MVKTERTLGRDRCLWWWCKWIGPFRRLRPWFSATKWTRGRIAPMVFVLFCRTRTRFFSFKEAILRRTSNNKLLSHLTSMSTLLGGMGWHQIHSLAPDFGATLPVRVARILWPLYFALCLLPVGLAGSCSMPASLCSTFTLDSDRLLQKLSRRHHPNAW